MKKKKPVKPMQWVYLRILLIFYFTTGLADAISWLTYFTLDVN